MAKAHSSRNRLLAPGISRFSRSQIFAKRALWKRNKGKPTKAVKAEEETTKSVEVKGEKNGGTRVISLQKSSRWYPAEDIPRPLANRKKARPTKLRASITPGTVLILLAGRFRGKRVVFLKQLESGLLLVTGPFKVNGVPLRRVNQAYVIATSTNVDISKIKIDAKITDSYFKREKETKKKGSEEEFFGEDKKKIPLPKSKIDDQKAVDKQVLAALSSVPQLRSYLTASFSLSKGQAPHAMQF